MQIAIIVLSILGILLLIGFLAAWVLHTKLFGRRYTPDPLIRYYTREEFGLSAAAVEFPCGKYSLKGFIYSYDNALTDKLIVFAHGMWSSTRAYMQDIEYLCRKGYRVLGFDYTGTDLSEGKRLKGLAQGVRSLSAALNYIQSQPEYHNVKIYVVGHSWGGFSTLNVVKYHPEVEGIVALAPFVSIPKVLKGMLPKGLYWMIPFVLAVEFIHCGKTAFVNAQRSLRSYPGKVLIIHSEDDPMVSYAYNTAELKKKCLNPRISYYITAGKRHNPQYTAEAVQALQEYSLRLQGLSPQEAEEFKKNTDYHELGRLDCEVMDRIVDFIND